MPAPEAPARTTPTVDEAVNGEPARPPAPTAEKAADKVDEAVPSPASKETASPPGFVAPKADSETASVDGAAALRETLKKFGAILDEPETTGEDTAAGGAAVEAPAGSRLPRPRPLDVDVEARLADQIQQIDFNDVPLIDCLDFVSEFSTIPITLDPDVLPYLRISPNTPLKIRKSDTTVGGLLGESLKDIGLGYTIEENQLFVTRVEDGGPRVRQVPFDLTDVVAGDAAQLELISRLIRELIAPESWKEAGGQGSIQVQGQSLQVQHEETILYQVLTFCEKLRVARAGAARQIERRAV